MSTNTRSGFPRRLTKRLKRDLDLYPVVAVFGARQVGKTTLARDIGSERGFSYITLDDRTVRTQAMEDPEGLLASVAHHGAVIDEVQRSPDLLLALKSVVDREQEIGRFILTGSNQPRLSASVADSLLGRVAYRTLRPLTISEQRFEDEQHRWDWFFDSDSAKLESDLAEAGALNGPVDWSEAVAAGGMPRALAAGPRERAQVLEDYARTFASRDVRDVLGVESTERFEAFLRLTAARTAQELNMSRMSSDLGESVSTVRRWIDALERSYLVTRIPPFSRNAGSRVTKTPKTFLVDSGLAMVAARERAPGGAHFETLILNDLLVWRDDAPNRSVSYWKIHSGPEVDFIVERDGRLVAIEAKAADSISRHDARHISPAAPWWAVL